MHIKCSYKRYKLFIIGRLISVQRNIADNQHVFRITTNRKWQKPNWVFSNWPTLNSLETNI